MSLREVPKYGVFSGSYFPAFGLNAERQKCPNSEFFLVCIFLHSDWVSLRIQSECGKIRTKKKLGIWTLFTQCVLFTINITFTSASFVSLCYPSTFHIRFLKNNYLTSKLTFTLLCLAVVVCITLLFYFAFFSHWIWSSRESNYKNIDGPWISTGKCRKIHHDLLENS